MAFARDIHVVLTSAENLAVCVALDILAAAKLTTVFNRMKKKNYSGMLEDMIAPSTPLFLPIVTFFFLGDYVSAIMSDRKFSPF